jgi:succinate-acetate transporter protein
MPVPSAPPAHDRRRRLDAHVVLRPQGSPFPLGLAGLALASLLVTGLDLGWIPLAEGKQVGFLLLVSAVPLQAVAAAFAFPGRDGAAAASMGILSATWAATGLTHLTSRPGATSNALGLVLLMSGALLLTSASTQATGKLLTAVVVGGAAVRFGFAGLYQLTGSGGWQNVSGAVGIAVATLALYTVWALQLEDEQHSTILPTLRRGHGEQAVAADGAAQLDGVEHEAGVRRQL